eukprot:TRINITY_DN1475_c0_g1_i15.p1 TRINITY_DN1475_c0_g1~~TRINITY_DN1475_c0_g1_i15.p1  ORF type:complete len:899 (-),score=231.35 TRINITY_DN1475_c0_g1_i15:56-2752(-)
MQFALGAGTLFTDRLSENSEYINTLTAQCVDAYSHSMRMYMEKLSMQELLCEEQDKPFDPSTIPLSIDPRLTAIVEGMFERCLAEQQYKQAMGIALESIRLDLVEKVVLSSDREKEMLQYCYDCCMKLVNNRSFKFKILQLLVTLFKKANTPDYMNMCRCLVFLGRASEISDIFTLLLGEDERKTLLVFQIGFELVDTATQQFRWKVKESLPEPPKENVVTSYDQNLVKIHNILSGELTVKLYLEFLIRNNNTDLGILNKIKSLFEARISILHTATIVANSIMHCGTTKDTFLRENLEWLSRAIAWSKFTTTAGLGVIHKGHISEAFAVLDPYLPKQGVESSPYTEGGSLFALGLIHSNQGNPKIISYLLQQLRNLDLLYLQKGNNNPVPGSLDPEKKKEVVQHGAALGLGLAAMGTANQEVFEELKHLCFTPKAAVAGEACGIAMGLIMLGTPTPNASELLNFAHQTQHEKVIRALGLGLGFTMYGLEEKADTMIESLTGDKDPVLRYSGQFTIALAYCGTANNSAIRKLLHVAVSDVSDDVRRAAVISLGFVLFRQPEQVPRLVSLLAESYNPHVRYGAALALGIACASTGMKEAITLLEPLSKDAVPFVRQGAFLGLAMVLLQISEQAEPKVKATRQLFFDVIGDKHQATMAKLGAILGMGILDAGGRNQTIALSSPSGHLNLSAIIGLVIFVQYWYWYPFLNFFSLVLSPTAVIGVNRNLEMPLYKIKSNAKPSLFAHPPQLKEPKEKVLKALPTALLSVTKKQQIRDSKKRKADKDGHQSLLMETEKDEKLEEHEKAQSAAKSETKTESEMKPEPESTFELLNNPARVTRNQFPFISFDVDPRYTPIIEGVTGVILLQDNKPEEEEALLPGSSMAGQDEEEEPEIPEPFEFLG